MTPRKSAYSRASWVRHRITVPELTGPPVGYPTTLEDYQLAHACMVPRSTNMPRKGKKRPSTDQPHGKTKLTSHWQQSHTTPSPHQPATATNLRPPLPFQLGRKILASGRAKNTVGLDRLLKLKPRSNTYKIVYPSPSKPATWKDPRNGRVHTCTGLQDALPLTQRIASSSKLGPKELRSKDAPKPTPVPLKITPGPYLSLSPLLC